jgi:hypothetical protein
MADEQNLRRDYGTESAWQGYPAPERPERSSAERRTSHAGVKPPSNPGGDHEIDWRD